MSTHIMTLRTVLTRLPINNTEKQMPKFLQYEVRYDMNTMPTVKAPGIDEITTELLQGGGETIEISGIGYGDGSRIFFFGAKPTHVT